jgi:hypothetical protein
MTSYPPADLNALNGWPEYKRQIASVEFIHALGQITLTYNYLEETIGMIFARFIHLRDKESEALYHRLNNYDRLALLTSFVEASSEPDKVKAAVLHLLGCYDICTENRNILMHTFAAPPDSSDITRLSKRARRDTARKIHFHITAAELKAIADEMMDIFDAGCMLHMWLVTGRDPRRTIEHSDFMGYPRPPEPAPLPAIPPKPRKLAPFEPPKDQKAGSPPPEPSQG